MLNQIYEDKVIVPLVTPSNMESFFCLIDHVLSGGVKNLLLFGTTGHGDKIGLETKKIMIEQLVPFIDHRARLFIALFGSSLSDVVYLANLCSAAGFAAAFVPLAFANDPQFFSQVLKETEIDYFLYNTPSSLTGEIHPALLHSKRVLGIKDSSGNIEYIQHLLTNHRRRDFKIYYGREYQIETALSLDIDGILPATGNIRPDLALRLWEKKDKETLALFYELKRQIDYASPGNYLQGLKNLLIQQGIIHE